MAPRICLLTESFHPKIGGGETHARLLSAVLVRRGVPVFILTQRQLRSWPRVDEVDGVPVRRVGVPGLARFGKFLMTPAALLALLRWRREYDIVYVCGFRTLGPVGVLVSRLTGCRCVLRAESCAELSGEDPVYRVRGGVHRRLMRALIGLRNPILLRAERFVSISRAITEEYLTCGVLPERVVVITNGIDTARFAPISPAEKQQLRRRLELPNRFLCIYTGKLNRGKGLTMLLRAWRRLGGGNSHLHLLLVGSGAHQFLSLEEELRRFVLTYDLERQITFTGAVSNVEDYLRASDLFLFPSQSEALGISLVEAMACGLPVVATRAGGIQDVVDDGLDGRLIEVGDEDGLVRAVESLYEDPGTRAALGRAARAKAVTAFGIDAVAEAHERLFRSLIEPPAVAPAVDASE
jgi:glycosyltransferase involved in cell wall biosynthesis